VNGAYYVGAAKKGRTRVLGQLRSLMRGGNTSELLQADWSHLGPEAFEVRFLPVAIDELYWLEMVLTKAMNATEEHGGYNKAIGRIRTLAARLRDTETKLVRSGKFHRFESVDKYDRVNPLLANTFCQKLHRLAEEIAALEERVSVSAEIIESLISSFEVFEAADLVGKRKSLH
jgi:hypothetical protein